MKKSTELCNTTGDEAASLIHDKIVDPTLPLKVGGRLLDNILTVTHAGDGYAVIEYSDGDELAVFQFAPNFDEFAKSAVDNDGQPVCTECEDH